MASENQIKLKVITPDRIFFEGNVDMVEFNTTEGEVGILADHIPMTLIVKPGLLRIIQPGETKEAALHAGFVEVLPEQITIMAEVVEWPNEIDESRAEKAKERAVQRLANKANETNVVRAEMALQRALARIDVLK